LKPYTGTQPVISLAYPTDGTSGPSGALIIGVPSKGNIAWDSLRTTKNIIIDGSNTPGGTTRDLTIQNLTTSHGNAFPMTIVGDVSKLVIKNCNIIKLSQSALLIYSELPYSSEPDCRMLLTGLHQILLLRIII
jgi:hypothetical protein